MKSIISACSLCLVMATSAWASHATMAQDSQPYAQISDQPGHDTIGKPADKEATTRTIEVKIRETASGKMLFEPDAIHIAQGSVVRFVISNGGTLNHEFFLGSFDEIKEHQLWNHKYPDSQHEGANAVAVPVGETAELVWEFSSMTNLEFACLIPGHREAGMWGVIIVHHHLAPQSNG